MDDHLIRFFNSKKKLRQGEGAFGAFVKLGNTANAEKRWRDASQYYSKALELHPADVAIRVQLGHALKEQELLDQAEQAYRQATLDDPMDADAYLHLGHVLKMQKSTTRAMAAYRTAARLGSAGPVGRDARHELSASGFRTSVPLNIDTSDLQGSKHSELASAVQGYRWAKALAILETSDATSPDIVMIKAQIYQILQRYDEAVSLYTDLAVRDAGGPASKALRSLHIEMGQGDKVIEALARDLENSITQAKPFDMQVELVNEMLSIEGLARVFDAGNILFAATNGSKGATSRTAVDVKRQRASLHLPGNVAAKLRDEFIERSAGLAEAGEHPQAQLLNDEAQALMSVK